MSSLFALPDRFNTPRPLFGQRVRSLPFPLDPTHFLLTEDALVRKAEYTATALNTADSEFTSAYLVANDITSEQGDAVFIRRTFATIPANRTEQIGSYAYSFPGLTGGTPVTTYTPSGYTGSIPGPYVITIGTHTIVTGNKVRVGTSSTITVGPIVLTANSSAVGTVTAYTATTITVGTLAFQNYPGGTNTFTSVALFIRGAGQITLPAPAYRTYEYFLPGVTSGITSAADIFPFEVFSPYTTTTGEAVTSLSNISTPTTTDYMALITARNYLCVESVVEQYLGNIVSRNSTFVQAK